MSMLTEISEAGNGQSSVVCMARLSLWNRFPLPSFNMSFLQAEERCKKQLDDAMKPKTRMGVGKPVYNVGQLVRFMLLYLVLSSAITVIRFLFSPQILLSVRSSEFV